MNKLNGSIPRFKMMNFEENIMLTWDKDSTDIKKEFDSEPAYNKNIFENQNKIS